MWRKALLVKYTGLPIPPPPPPLFFFLKYTFNFSQTVGEMVFVSFEVEKMRMFLVHSMARWCWVLLRSWGAVVSFGPCEGSVPVSRRSVGRTCCGQQASLFMHRHGRAAFPILLQILLLFQILGHRCRIFEGIKDHYFNLRTTRPHRNLRTVCPLLLSLCQVSISVSKSVSKSPSQSFSFVQLVFWLNLIHIQQVSAINRFDVSI